MKGIILAAGRGNRLGTLTNDRPKGMVELDGSPLLRYQMTALRKGGVSDLIIVRGYMGGAIPFKDVCYLDNERWNSTNMFASLLTARQHLQQESCVISYADIVYPPEVVRALLGSTGDIRITYDPQWYSLWKERFADPLGDAETFQIDQSGILKEIGGKTNTLDDIRGQYMGLLHFSPAGWQKVEELITTLTGAEIDKLDMTSLLRKLIARQVAIQAVAIDSPWLEADSTEDLAIYENWLTDGNHRHAKMIRGILSESN